MRCSWNTTGSRPCPNEATHTIGEYALCDDHDQEVTARVSHDYPITLPAGRVDANGDVIMQGFLPACAPQRSDESTMDHGLRVLAFILAEHVTATLSDLELERADYAAGFAVTAREILPLAVDRISAVRHEIYRILKFRRTPDPIDQILATRPIDTRPNEGPMAKLIPAPITNPPAGSYADARPNLRDRIQF